MKRNKTNWKLEALTILRDSAIITGLFVVILWIAKAPTGLEWWRGVAMMLVLFCMKPFL